MFCSLTLCISIWKGFDLRYSAFEGFFHRKLCLPPSRRGGRSMRPRNEKCSIWRVAAFHHLLNEIRLSRYIKARISLCRISFMHALTSISLTTGHRNANFTSEGFNATYFYPEIFEAGYCQLVTYIRCPYKVGIWARGTLTSTFPGRLDPIYLWQQQRNSLH